MSAKSGLKAKGPSKRNNNRSRKRDQTLTFRQHLRGLLSGVPMDLSFDEVQSLRLVLEAASGLSPHVEKVDVPEIQRSLAGTEAELKRSEKKERSKEIVRAAKKVDPKLTSMQAIRKKYFLDSQAFTCEIEELRNGLQSFLVPKEDKRDNTASHPSPLAVEE